jgi:hypothetical protein
MRGALFGVVTFDAVSVGVARMNASDNAAEAAGFGADAWSQTHDVKAAFQAASDYADEHGSTIDPKSFVIDRDGTVHVTLVHEATTLLLFRSKSTKKWTRIVATGARRPV